MRWDEIPKLINTESCYHVTHGLRSFMSAIEEFESDGYHQLQLNPDFQRGHVWTEKQQIAYMEYVLRGGQSGRSFYFNKPSWRTQKSVNDYDDFVCVDGLQRITAIKRFLNNEIKVFGQYYRDFDRPLRHIEIAIDLYVNDLKTKQDVLTWYIQMNSGGTPHSKEEIERVKVLLEECVK